MAASCQIAKAKLARHTANLQGPSSLPSRIGTAVRAGFIGNLKALGRNVVGNATHLGFRGLVAQPAQAGVDYIRAVNKAVIESRRSGESISPTQYREVVSGLNLDGFNAFKRGWGQGVDEVKGAYNAAKQAYHDKQYVSSQPGSAFGQKIAAAMEEAKLHILTSNEKSLSLDYTETRYKNPLSQAIADATFIFAEGTDRPFYYAAEQMSLQMQARLAALKAVEKSPTPLTGKTRTERVQAIADELVKNPPDDMAAQASLDAHYATFKDQGIIAKTAQQVKRGFERAAASDNPAIAGSGTAAKLAGDVIIPFTGVPTSIAIKGAELTPMGVLGLLGNLEHKGGMKFGVKEKGLGGARNAQLIANSLLGLGGVALGKQLADAGILTGKLTPQQRADDPNAMEYSIKVRDHRVSLMVLGPLAVPLFAGAALASQHKKNPQQSALEDVGGIARSAAEQTLNSTYMQGVKNVLDVGGDERKSAASMLAQAVPIPSMVTQAARVLDPQPREAKTFLEKVAARTPLSATLPPALNATGVVPERTALERAGALVNPVDIKPQREQPEIDALMKLGVNIGKPLQTMQRNGVSIPIPRDAYQTLLENQGKFVTDMVGQKLADPEFMKRSDAMKKIILESVVRAAKARAKGLLEADLRSRPETLTGFMGGQPQ